MPERFFDLATGDRAEALAVAAANLGRPAHLLEKDVWVVWTLAALFDSPLGSALTFKGGTSLSKVYRVIERFSEDIDLTYDIRELLPDLVKHDAPLPKSNSQAKKWTEAVRKRLPVWITEKVEPVIRDALARDGIEATVLLGGDEHDKLFVDYDPLRSGTGYVSPRVVLEFGARATGEPHDRHRVVSDMAGHVPEVTFPEATARVMKVERTFWEKATAAHVYCRRGSFRGERFSRHWYDLAAISETSPFDSAVNERAIATAVADHKSWFFAEKDASGTTIDYHAAVGGGLDLVPRGVAHDALEADYAKMIEDGLLVRGRAFDELMEACAKLEMRANAAALARPPV